MTLRHDCFKSQTYSVLLLTVIGQRHVTSQAHKPMAAQHRITCF
jgi:hypothetical protein